MMMALLALAAAEDGNDDELLSALEAADDGNDDEVDDELLSALEAAEDGDDDDVIVDHNDNRPVSPEDNGNTMIKRWGK